MVIRICIYLDFKCFLIMSSSLNSHKISILYTSIYIISIATMLWPQGWQVPRNRGTHYTIDSLIEKQLPRWIIIYNKCLAYPLLFYATQILIFLILRISANHDKEDDGLSVYGEIRIKGIVSLLYILYWLHSTYQQGQADKNFEIISKLWIISYQEIFTVWF